MLYISEILNNKPKTYENELRRKVYEMLEQLDIPYQRVDTNEVITMDDCIEINRLLDIEMVKTLFLCNRQQTEYYLFITRSDKPFRSKDFSSVMEISRVSFAPVEKMEEMMGTIIGAATVFGVLLDKNRQIQVVFDKEVADSKWYGCSDGVTTGYLKIETNRILKDFLKFANHEARIIEV